MVLTVGCKDEKMGSTEVEVVEIDVDNLDIPVHFLTLEGLDETYSIEVNHILDMERQQLHTASLNKEGETVEADFDGIYLNELLKDYKIREEDFDGIQLIAGDGYAMVVPYELLQDKDIFIAHKPYDEAKSYLPEEYIPLMTVIKDERTMYWVKNLHTIQFISNGKVADKKDTKELVFLEAIDETIPLEDYTYYESVDQAISIKKLMDSYKLQDNNGEIIAVDGLVKEETADILSKAYLKITGKNKPLFLGPDLPKGMHVKEVLSIEIANTTFISLDSGLKVYEQVEVGDSVAISVMDLLEMNNIGQAATYTFKGASEDKDYSKDALKQAYILKVGENYSLGFADAVQGIEKVKSLSCQIESASDVYAKKLGNWEIQVKNGEDVYNLTPDLLQHMELREFTADLRKKDGSVIPQKWQGYILKDVLSLLTIQANEATIIADDGYAAMYSSEIIEDPDTIIGIIRDDEVLSLPTVLSKSQRGNFWIKNASTIEINQ